MPVLIVNLRHIFRIKLISETSASRSYQTEVLCNGLSDTIIHTEVKKIGNRVFVRVLFFRFAPPSIPFNPESLLQARFEFSFLPPANVADDDYRELIFDLVPCPTQNGFRVVRTAILRTNPFYPRYDLPAPHARSQ